MACKFCESSGQIWVYTYSPADTGIKKRIKYGVPADCPKCNGSGNVIKAYAKEKGAD